MASPYNTSGNLLPGDATPSNYKVASVTAQMASSSYYISGQCPNDDVCEHLTTHPS